MNKELNSWEEVKSYLEYVLYDKRGTRALGYTSTSGYLQPFIDDVEKALKDYELMKEIRITARFDLAQVNKEHKALEIIKETPIFAWYITIYKDAYEMVSDVKGFRTNNSVEELQEMFDLLKEVLL